MSNALNERVIIVTGASAGIVRASAQMFATGGVKVVSCARLSEESADLTDESCQRVLVDITTGTHDRLVQRKHAFS